MSSLKYLKAPRAVTSRLLLFGGTGSIGAAVDNYFQARQWDVIVVTRREADNDRQLAWNPIASSIADDPTVLTQLKLKGPFDAVCWSQGANCSDSLYDFNADQHTSLYQANVLYILNSLHILLCHELLRTPARLCVISSIWQKIARQNKLSYCISKAALEGLVLSAAVDLARDGHVINAVLPGVIDTPMARANLSVEQVRKVENSTLFDRLATLDEVAACVYNLCQPQNSAITGQFIAVDLGYSHVRII